MGTGLSPWVVNIDTAHRLLECSPERRTRRQAAYLIHDAEGTLIVVQKLQYAAVYINNILARAPSERVSLASLFEATDTIGNRVDGFHKKRYRIQRCAVHHLHDTFEKLREELNIQKAVVVTNSPDSYPMSVK